MDLKHLPEEINVDESFDEFDFWCKLLGTSEVELVKMPEPEIKRRMDRAQAILTQRNKRLKEQQNRLDFLHKLNVTFSEFQKNKSNRKHSNQDISKFAKDKMKLKLRHLMRERGGSDIVNLLVQAAAEVSRSFGDRTCMDNLDVENVSLSLQGTQGSDTFVLEASSNCQGDNYSRSTKGAGGNSELFQKSNCSRRNLTDQSVSSSGAGGTFDAFEPPANSSFQFPANRTFNRTQSLGGTCNRTQNLGGTFSRSGPNLGGTFNATQNLGGTFNATRSLGAICNETQNLGPCNTTQNLGPCNATQNLGGTFNATRSLGLICNETQNLGACNTTQNLGPCNTTQNLGGTFNATRSLGAICNETQNLGACNTTQNLGPCNTTQNLGTCNTTQNFGTARGDSFNRTRSINPCLTETAYDGDLSSSYYSNSLIQEAFHDTESFERSRRSDYDSNYELNRTNRDRALAHGIQSPFCPHPRMVSSPVTRRGRKPHNYNRVDCEFEEDRMKHYESEASVNYFPPNAYDATRYSGMDRLFDSNATYRGIEEMFGSNSGSCNLNETYNAGNATFDAGNRTYDAGSIYDTCNTTYETCNEGNATYNAGNETYDNAGNETYDTGSSVCPDTTYNANATYNASYSSPNRTRNMNATFDACNDATF